MPILQRSHCRPNNMPNSVPTMFAKIIKCFRRERHRQNQPRISRTGGSCVVFQHSLTETTLAFATNSTTRSMFANDPAARLQVDCLSITNSPQHPAATAGEKTAPLWTGGNQRGIGGLRHHTDRLATQIGSRGSFRCHADSGVMQFQASCSDSCWRNRQSASLRGHCQFGDTKFG